jgi:glycosyltransferase involved in cell wall biosynthesis
MAAMPSVALIISTYNRPVALDRVLDSVSRQRVMPEQVIVADDGSDARTAAVVGAWRSRLGPRLSHVWQPDDGFRLAASRIRAAREAGTDLLVFVDGDCLLRPSIVLEHQRLAEAGCAVAGNRILLSPRLTRAIEAGQADPVAWGIGEWTRARLAGDVERLAPLLTLPGQAWRRLRPVHWLQMRGCNMAIARTDFERVNGFEEQMTGWGFEDSDIAIRLINSGIKVKSGRFATAVLHLWHRELARDDAERNRQRALAARRNGVVLATLGLRERSADERFDPPQAGACAAEGGSA